jgi:predicted aldo/keto reductase-like oxidoreductase
MTKGRPDSASDARKLVERQLRDLGVERIDLYAWHGLNDQATFEKVCKRGGAVEELHKLVEEGLIGSVGFSTHAPTAVILNAIESGLFAFMNLHYYYFFQSNAPAVAAAAARDMGVFIISPNDKGGQLFDPPHLLREMTAPLTPLQWNARFCLGSPHVHTLSFGMTAPAHFQEMLGVLPVSSPLDAHCTAAKQRLDARLALDPHAGYEGYELLGDRSGIVIPEVLRLRRLWKCYDLLGYGRYRYNFLKNPDHWYPGAFASEDNLAKIERGRLPRDVDVIALLRETHAALYRD